MCARASDAFLSARGATKWDGVRRAFAITAVPRYRRCSFGTRRKTNLPSLGPTAGHPSPIRLRVPFRLRAWPSIDGIRRRPAWASPKLRFCGESDGKLRRVSFPQSHTHSPCDSDASHVTPSQVRPFRRTPPLLPPFRNAENRKSSDRNPLADDLPAVARFSGFVRMESVLGQRGSRASIRSRS